LTSVKRSPSKRLSIDYLDPHNMVADFMSTPDSSTTSSADRFILLEKELYRLPPEKRMYAVLFAHTTSHQRIWNSHLIGGYLVDPNFSDEIRVTLSKVFLKMPFPRIVYSLCELGETRSIIQSPEEFQSLVESLRNKGITELLGCHDVLDPIHKHFMDNIHAAALVALPNEYLDSSAYDAFISWSNEGTYSIVALDEPDLETTEGYLWDNIQDDLAKVQEYLHDDEASIAFARGSINEALLTLQRLDELVTVDDSRRSLEQKLSLQEDMAIVGNQLIEMGWSIDNSPEVITTEVKGEILKGKADSAQAGSTRLKRQ